MLSINQDRKQLQFFHLWYIILIYYPFLRCAQVKYTILLYKFLYSRTKGRRYWGKKAIDILYIKFRKKTEHLLSGKVYSSGLLSSFKILRTLWKRLNYRFWWKLKKKKKYIFAFRKYHRKRSLNILKYINFSKKFNNYKRNKTLFSLRGRTFINPFLVKTAVKKYLYKQIKYKVFRTQYRLDKVVTSFYQQHAIKHRPFFKRKNTHQLIFVNNYKRLLWKIRKSRITHWEFETSGCVNKRRYQKLLKYTLVKKSNWTFQQLFAIFITHLNRFSLSWRQVMLLHLYQLYVIDGVYTTNPKYLNRGSIVEVCFGEGLKKHMRVYNLLNKRIVYRLRRWGYKSHVAYSNNKKPRQIPKSVKSVGLGYKLFGKSVAYSKSLGLAAILVDLNTKVHHPLTSIYRTSIIKLNNWRYRFN